MAYTQPTLSGYNSNPPPDDGSTGASNTVSWAAHKNKLGDPLKTFMQAVDTNVAAAFAEFQSTSDDTLGFHLVFHPRTAAEQSAGVTPVNYEYEPGNVLRYGTNTTPGTTDMTTAIQNALDVVDAAGGGIVFFPAGQYITTSTLTVSNLVSLVGESMGSANNNGTSIDGSSGTHHILDVTRAGPSSEESRITIYNLAIHGNSTGDGIRLSYVSYVTIEKVFVDGANVNVRFINDCFNNAMRDCYIANATTYGIYFDIAGSDINVNLFENIQFNTNTNVHFYIAAGASYNNTISNCNFNGGGVSVWGCNGAYDTRVINNAIETGLSLSRAMYFGTSDYDSNVVPATYANIITGNQFTGSGSPTYNLEMVNGNQNTVIDNHCLGVGPTAHIRIDGVSYSYFRNFTNTAQAMYSVNGSWTTCRIESHGANVLSFTDQDTTPSVLPDQGGVNAGTIFKTANTVATTITDLDNGFVGQTVKVIINDINTTIDFTASGLKGNNGADWSPTTGDHMDCQYDGLDWYCVISDNTA